MSVQRQVIWHTVPRNDLREHDLSSTCWCHPTQHWEYENYWIHNSMDQREFYETGERKPT